MDSHSTGNATATPVQQAAMFLYQWYTSPLEAPLPVGEGLASFQRVVGSPINSAGTTRFAGAG